MAQTLESFVNDVIGEAPLKASGVPWYNPAGDCIHYHWRDDEFYRDWMDDKLTVYRSHKNDEAVGCEIKGIHALLDKMGDFGISVNHKTGVPLAIFLFISHVAAAPSDEKIIAREKIYRYIMGMVGKETVNLTSTTEAPCAK